MMSFSCHPPSTSGWPSASFVSLTILFFFFLYFFFSPVFYTLIYCHFEYSMARLVNLCVTNGKTQAANVEVKLVSGDVRTDSWWFIHYS